MPIADDKEGTSISEGIKGANSDRDIWVQSPIEERHIDFLLEEEFASNRDFLDFFVAAATASCVGKEDRRIPSPREEAHCRAVRSVTTTAGESDVLVVYQSADEPSLRVAVLIEDKISATFQNEQAARYVERGRAGVGTIWDVFWTCLVAPQKYASGLAGFDARVSLESVHAFFHKVGGPRSSFKAGVIERALNDARTVGVRKVDLVMTRFRAFYAERAERRFAGSGLHWEPARDAWWSDYWFWFRGGPLPQSTVLVHKATAGTVQLSFRNTNAQDLAEALGRAAEQSGITVVQTGKSAALQIDVQPICNFNDVGDETASKCEGAYFAVEKLLHLWEEKRQLLSPQKETIHIAKVDQHSREMLCLQAIFEGLVRGRALEYGVPPVDLIPSLIELAQSSDKSRYFTVPGMTGGFQVAVVVNAEKPVIVLAESGSRIHNGWLRHKLTANSLESSSYDMIEDVLFEDWVEDCRGKL